MTPFQKKSQRNMKCRFYFYLHRLILSHPFLHGRLGKIIDHVEIFLKEVIEGF